MKTATLLIILALTAGTAMALPGKNHQALGEKLLQTPASAPMGGSIRLVRKMLRF